MANLPRPLQSRDKSDASAQPKDEQPVGVCYGTQNGDQEALLAAENVIDLCEKKNIRRMRIYRPDLEALQVLQARSKTHIELILGVPNSDLKVLAKDSAMVGSWVDNNVKNYHPDVKFRYIAVGNIEKDVDDATRNYVPDAMKKIFDALVSAGLQDKIKVSTAIDTALLLPNPNEEPSKGTFNPNIQSFLEKILDFLRVNKSPLLVNVNTYFHFIKGPDSIPLDYALFSPSSFVVKDGKHEYKNLFDAILDTLYSALEKTKDWRSLKDSKDCSSLEKTNDWEIVVSSGWPSHGDKHASKENAQKYNQNLIDRVKKGSTPKTSGKAIIETYVHAMFNENNKKPEYENHFGLFQLKDLNPVYELNFA